MTIEVGEVAQDVFEGSFHFLRSAKKAGFC